MKKTGILGGTFNPIHIGHLILAEQAMSQYGLDSVLMIPTGTPYFKKGISMPSGDIRLKMAELAVMDNPSFQVSDIEVKREGNTYTIDTLRELRRLEPETRFFFIIGADILFEIESWKESEEIFKNCEILASVRDNETPEALLKRMDELKERYGAEVHLINTTSIEISSSMIRKLASEKKSIRYYVPEGVREYIEKNKIYE